MSDVLFEIKEAIGFITLNRPQKYNAFNRNMSLQLIDILEQCEQNIAVRCVFISGEGKAFSAGQDLAEVADPNGPDLKTILVEHYNPIVSRIRSLNKPVIAAVNGVAAGAGANIALCCDIVVAAKSAVFIQAFSKIGLIPDSGGTFILPRLIGLQRATAIMMLGDKIAAEEAESIGMIYKAYSDDQFSEAAFKLARTLAALPTKGLAYTKQALNESFSNTFEVQLSLEDHLQQKAGSTNDFKEGVEAFLEKRQPEFKGD